MNWSSVGKWIKDNAGPGAALIGSLVSGNAPGAIAAGMSLISSATGTDDPQKALEVLKNDPQAMVRLRELANQEQDSIRKHLESMKRLDLEDQQTEHHETQETVRGGDTATDKYVRRTRPKMARESWNATVAYCLGCLLFKAFMNEDLFSIYVAGFLSAPAWAYLGLRTGDKFASALGSSKK